MAKSIPDRWIPYKACGEVIEGTRIVCFKVPLRKGVQEHNKAIKEIWDIKTLLKKIPNLGGVVDLTNTDRYYNPSELKAEGVLHKKILMPGRVIPPENKVTQFMDTIDEFLGRHCDIVIGVHCTHGLNRTGYMVCRYMRDRLGISANDAIKRFENARGYKIERENYIANLLGKDPLPADVGPKETKVIPIHNNDKSKYKPRHKTQDMEYRSPLNEYEETKDDERSYGYRSRYNNHHYKTSKYDDEESNSTSRDTSSSTSRWNMSGMSHKPYSYKHDY